MKRLIVILLLIPSLVFGAYTEFYCRSGGSNLNGGGLSTGGEPATSAAYTSTNGNWNGSNIFTPTDGSTPASTVNVGDFASVYLDAASVAVFVARVTAVGAGTNGTITVSSTAKAGVVPTSGSTGRSIKVGGAWLGPNASSWFPWTLSGTNNLNNAGGDRVRFNLKNDAAYSVTASTSTFNAGSSMLIQGYGSTPNDGSKATIDGGTSTAVLVTDVGTGGMTFADLIFKTSFTTGTSILFTTTRLTQFFRCVFTGARSYGISLTLGSNMVECEFYANNQSNGSNGAAVLCSAPNNFLRCIFHDNTGSNTSGLITGGGPIMVQNCIFDTNGQYGISITSGTNNGIYFIGNCDFYNNGSNGINIASTTANPTQIENCNFIKNTGAGINAPGTGTNSVLFGSSFNNGYGSGTQANGSSDTLGNLAESGKVTYGSNLTPWVDPANGNFAINLAAAIGAGRGAFTTTASSYGPTVGYPDIGAAQSSPAPTCVPTPTATATATPTSTPTPTATASATSTPTPTPPIESSYGFQG